MGKKSKKASKKEGKSGSGVMGKDTASVPPTRARCASCRRFLKDVTKQATRCPGCDKVYCEPCATFGPRDGRSVGFVSCSHADCPHPPRCADCAFGTTLNAIGEDNKARRARGEEPIVIEREGKADYPVSVCGNCGQLYCFPCHTFSIEGVHGHSVCYECGKVRCFACCVESGDPSHFIMHCWGCEMSKCTECDPDMTWDGSTGHFYCGKCSSDPGTVPGEMLVPAAAFNDFCKKDGDE